MKFRAVPIVFISAIPKMFYTSVISYFGFFVCLGNAEWINILVMVQVFKGMALLYTTVNDLSEIAKFMNETFVYWPSLFIVQ